MIQLRDVNKRFGHRPAVEHLNLSVPRGEIYGLLGHNGAGKSTTIGMLLGQVWPDGGEVLVCGHDVTRRRAAALHEVGAIFESPVFYDFLSGWRNLEILTHYTAPTPAARIREVLDWVGLTGREHSKVRTYSHGMRTRLALAQALLPRPALLILDEPADGLDPEGIHEWRQTILRLHQELGLTILLSSHQLNEVEQLCTRIAVLRQGRKVFEGPIRDARHLRSRVRLVVDDFPRAAQELTAARLILHSAVPEGHCLPQRGTSTLGKPTRKAWEAPLTRVPIPKAGGSESRTRVTCPSGTTPANGNGFVELAEGVGTDQLVRRLVELGFQVHELAREEQTLEDFYLSLMKQSPPAGNLPTDH